MAYKGKYYHNHKSEGVDLKDVDGLLAKQRADQERAEQFQKLLEDADLEKVKKQEAYPGEHADLAASRGIKPSGLEIINEPDLIRVETFNNYPEEEK